MTSYTHLTTKELLDQLTLRDDLTALEHELVDRLLRSEEELERLSAFKGTLDDLDTSEELGWPLPQKAE